MSVLSYYVKRIKMALNIKTINREKKCEIAFSTGYDENTKFEGHNKIWPHVALQGSEIGYMSYVGTRAKLSQAKIGRYCSIARDVEVIAGNHPTRDFVSTHPAFYLPTTFGGKTYCDRKKYEEYSYVDGKWMVEIGNDVWLGQGVKIMNGVRIGDGAIVASYAVVSKDVPPYAIVGGVPAKVIRYRFEKEEIEWLLNLKWWDKPQEWIEEYKEEFENIQKLKEIIKDK